MSGLEQISHRLQERVKELTALHQASEILQDDDQDITALLKKIAAIIPPAWQYPEVTMTRLSFDGLMVTSDFFAETSWKQDATFETNLGKKGSVEVFYREFCSLESEGPFLLEERNLIDSLTKMLKGYFNRREMKGELVRSNQELESRVQQRTKSLCRLTSKLLRVEENQRRAIAEDLHDHIGQTLAMMRFKLKELQNLAVRQDLGGHVDSLIALIEKTITYTRTLTVELSPPILYELGVVAAVEWLVEQVNEKYAMRISFVHDVIERPLSDDVKIALFKSVNELLMNVVKHAGTAQAEVRVEYAGDEIVVSVTDEGKGFDMGDEAQGSKNCFGLFSVRERLAYLGGGLNIASRRGGGTRAVVTARIQ